MHYSSRNGFAKDRNCDVTTCPLVRWKEANHPGEGVKPDKDNAELISEFIEVSELDKYGTRHLYPWAE